jgi:dCMP deaminase
VLEDSGALALAEELSHRSGRVRQPDSESRKREDLKPASDHLQNIAYSCPSVSEMVSREKQIERDTYYMGIARAVEEGANCLGSHVGAVVVLDNRVISTGYNGTPTGFANCNAGGCVRCRDSSLFKEGRADEMSDSSHRPGAALDRCICVHAEQNAFMSAARFGIALEGATLYSTLSPCFNCLKEALQVGIERIVYGNWYKASYSEPIANQYIALYRHLMGHDPMRFEAVGGERPVVEVIGGQPDPYAESGERVVFIEPPAADSA